MRRIAIGLLGALVASGAAMAADMPTKAPMAPVVAAYNWTGWYAGVNAGYAWTRTSPGLSDCAEVPVVAFCAFAVSGEIGPISLTPKGFIGGGQVGYNWQAGNFVWGLEADIQGSGVKASATQTTPAGFFISGTVSQEHKLTWFGTVRGRVGVPVNNWLFYATGGLIYGGVSSAVTASATNGYVATGSSSTTRAGWTVGAGSEVGFAARWTARVEYLYFDLGSDSTIVRGTPAAFIGDVITYSHKTAGHLVRGALNYRF